MKKDLVIIGGGPAGLAAAIAAKEAGVEDLLILERDSRLGGILNQCIHNGFGLHTFKEELTGPEYAGRYISKAEEMKIPYKLNTMVVDLTMSVSTEELRGSQESQEQRSLSKNAYAVADSTYGSVKKVTVMNREEGMYDIEAKAVILAMGCRERSRGALNIPGYRPAGIYSAGTAQRYVNIEGRMPGKEVVILGSGDIGLIMARRMTLEGAKVKLVAELMPYSGGLKRNIVQCLDDFGIPLKLSHTVVDIKGKERVESVTVAQVDADSKPIPGTEEEIPCDTLLLSCGLIPENELSENLGMAMSASTGGPLVNESLETDREGVFACGNVLHVHDLVDYVSEEAAQAGKNAAVYLQGGLVKSENEIRLRATSGVRYTVPASIDLKRMTETQIVRFRVGSVFRDAQVQVSCGDKILKSLKKRVLAPGEMEQVVLKRSELENIENLEEIVFSIQA